jgi:hypothetical protein
MFKKLGLGVAVLLLVAIGFVWVKLLMPLQASADKNGPDTAARDYALQDNSKLTLPTPQAAIYQAAPNPDMNLYWGELHLHTAESFDATLFGNTLGIEDAYRFAKGEPLNTAGGEVMQLSRPLDFVAITDHAEGFGTRTHCDSPGLSLGERAACWLANEPNPMIFQTLTKAVRGTAAPGDPSKPAGVYQRTTRQRLKPGAFPTCRVGDGASERCYENAADDWARNIHLADQYYEPGVLTTLIGYEYSPGMPDQGKHHRNIIFRSNSVPQRALSSLDVPNAIELWKGLEANCPDDCDFLTIPHNPNIHATPGMDRNIMRPTGACARSANRWRKYSRSRAHRSVHLGLALRMKSAPSNRCSTPASRAKPPAAPLKPVLSARGLRSGWSLSRSWDLTLCRSVISPPLTATTLTLGMWKNGTLPAR